VTGWAVVVAVVPKALLLRNAPNRLGRLVVTAAATMGASARRVNIGVYLMMFNRPINFFLIRNTCGGCCRRSGGGRGGAGAGAETAVSGGQSPGRSAAGSNRCAVPSRMKKICFEHVTIDEDEN
jgi:hypothetical protein